MGRDNKTRPRRLSNRPGTRSSEKPGVRFDGKPAPVAEPAAVQAFEFLSIAARGAGIASLGGRIRG